MADDRKREPLAYRPTKRAVVRELVSLACLACVLATASIYWHSVSYTHLTLPTNREV